MKKTLSLIAMYAAMGGISDSIILVDKPQPKKQPIPPKPPINIDQDKLNEAKGLKKFYYGLEYVWALNQKSADKKARKKGLIP